MISLHEIHRQHVDSEAGKVALFNCSLFGQHQSISRLAKQALLDITFYFLGLQSIRVGVCVVVASRFLVDSMSASVWRSVPTVHHEIWLNEGTLKRAFDIFLQKRNVSHFTIS